MYDGSDDDKDDKDNDDIDDDDDKYKDKDDKDDDTKGSDDDCCTCDMANASSVDWQVKNAVLRTAVQAICQREYLLFSNSSTNSFD